MRAIHAVLNGAAAVLVALAVAGCAGVGAPVPGAPAHHRERGFANPWSHLERPGFWPRAGFFVRRVLAATFAPRRSDQSAVANDGSALRGNRGEPTLTWIGHSTLLLQLDGVNVLTDPQWSERASPVSFAGPRRLVPPGVAFEHLPSIQVVLLSHDHYDHLDARTVERLAAVHRPRFVVPLGIRAWLADRGIHDVVELDWWQSVEIDGLRFTSVPAKHFSGRSPRDANRRLWTGWTIAGRDRRAYFAGDTGYSEVLAEIGRRLGPFDVAALPIGAYLPQWLMKPAHLTPEEALDVFRDVGARRFVAIHWGTFDLADEPIDDPPRRLAAEARKRGLDPDRVWILTHGETRRW